MLHSHGLGFSWFWDVPFSVFFFGQDFFDESHSAPLSKTLLFRANSPPTLSRPPFHILILIYYTDHNCFAVLWGKFTPNTSQHLYNLEALEINRKWLCSNSFLFVKWQLHRSFQIWLMLNIAEYWCWILQIVWNTGTKYVKNKYLFLFLFLMFIVLIKCKYKEHFH